MSTSDSGPKRRQVAALQGGAKFNATKLQQVPDVGEISLTPPTHWLKSQARYVLEMRPAPKGKMCTVFAFIGVSRTPQPLIVCTTGDDHDHDDDHHH